MPGHYGKSKTKGKTLTKKQKKLYQLVYRKKLWHLKRGRSNYVTL